MDNIVIVGKISEGHDKLSVNEIVNCTDTGIIIKGARINKGKSSIIYLIDPDINHRYFKNETISVLFTTRDNKKITFDFIPWESLKIKNKSMISGYTNMTSDKSRHNTYIIRGKV